MLLFGTKPYLHWHVTYRKWYISFGRWYSSGDKDRELRVLMMNKNMEAVLLQKLLCQGYFAARVYTLGTSG
jgi:hypothetical protein